jgi:cell division protein FtsL
MKLKKAGITTKIVITALIVYACISLVTVQAQVEETRRARDELITAVAEASRENAELQYEIEHADDPATIEAIARSKLGLVKPGEKIFYDIGQ